MCEGGIGKTKPHLDLNLLEDLEGNNRTWCVSAWGGAGQLDKGQEPKTTFIWAELDTAKGAFTGSWDLTCNPPVLQL